MSAPPGPNRHLPDKMWSTGAATDRKPRIADQRSQVSVRKFSLSRETPSEPNVWVSFGRSPRPQIESGFSKFVTGTIAPTVMLDTYECSKNRRAGSARSLGAFRYGLSRASPFGIFLIVLT